MMLNLDVNTDGGLPGGNKPLGYTTWYGHEAIFKMLLAKEEIDVNSKSSAGDTALILTAKEGHETIAKMLLERQDIDVNCKGD